jgi:L-fuculose-phosphate aldolase
VLRSGGLKPSSEIKMHRDFYDARPDVRAVCHAHPITATGFAVAGISLDRCTLPEVVITLGAVPLVKYGVPGSDELTQDILENYVKDYDAFLLANHGVVTVGQSLMNAYYKMETVEHFAKISLAARQLGNENVFSPARAQELVDARQRYGVQAGAGCRIEYKDASYAQEVPMSGVAYGAPATSNTTANGEVEMSEAEVAQLVSEVAKRIVKQING